MIGGSPRRFLAHLRSSWWFIPDLCLLAAVGLSVLLGAIDARLDAGWHRWYLFRGGPEAARTVLSVVAASMLTFAGLVFSVTILVLQLASTQFSPRVMRTFLRDRTSQLSLGIFAGTFVYALLTLRSVRGTAEGIERNVPSLSIWVAGALAVLCVGVFISYIHHIAQSIRAVMVIERIASETRRALERLYPDGRDEEPAKDDWHRPPAGPSRILCNPGTPGVVESVDEEELLQQAKKADVVLSLRPMLGEFIPHGDTLFEVWGDPCKLDTVKVIAAINLATERTFDQDAAFGFRQLVDIAERALSPGTNDPSTAVQVLNQLHDLLLRLVRRRFPSPYRFDNQGALRLVLPRPDFASYVRLAFEEIRHYGASSIQVSRRLEGIIESLYAAAPHHRRAILNEQRRGISNPARP